MAKQKRKKKIGTLIFVLFMILYAGVFLGLTHKGLTYFWDFIEAYEISRPKNTIDAYMEQLSPEYIADSCTDLIAQVDHNIQSEESCKEVIVASLSEGITCAKKVTECTDTKLVYVLRSGGRVIGQVQLEPRGQESYGFTPWEVTGDSFDMSFLLTDTVSTIAPHNYPVLVNGVALDEGYITETGIRYTALEEFSEKIEQPYIVSYTAGPCLGSISLQVTDPEGNPVTIDENTDMNTFLTPCTEEEEKDLADFNQKFIKRYVGLLTSKYDTRYDNYDALVPYMRPGSDLASRTKNALEGLAFGRSNSDRVVSITINHSIRLDESRYVCDITYVVDSLRYVGVVQTTTNVKVIIVNTEDGLLADTLITY